MSFTVTEVGASESQTPAAVLPPYIPGMEGGECSLCAVNPALCEELGPNNAIRGLGYRGENARLRRMLARLRSGKPFNVAVVGGSVSKGYSIFSHHPNVDPRNMHRIVFDHLNAKFPGKGEPKIEGESAKAEGRNGITNGALGATGTDYFQYCFGESIPDDVDLVLIEQAINDHRKLEFAEHYEQLVRSLLDLPGQPAIINIHAFGLIFENIATGGDMHLGTAEYYDIPTINLRNIFLPQILEDPEAIKDLFCKDRKEVRDELEVYDLRHVCERGHRIAGNLTSAYIDMQLCEMDRIERAAGHSRVDELYPLPRLPRQGFNQRFEAGKTMPKLKPNCFTMNAEKNKLVPSKSDGWREWFHPDVPSKKYMIADKPGASISVKFRTSLGRVELHYLTSGTFGLGSVDCSVDGGQKRRFDGHENLRPGVNVGRAKVLAEGLAPGEHELTCVLLDQTAHPGGGKEFRLISVLSV
ncbi:CAP64-like protein, partial [Cutaneotrichosporon oleaginosum]